MIYGKLLRIIATIYLDKISWSYGKSLEDKSFSRMLDTEPKWDVY